MRLRGGVGVTTRPALALCAATITTAAMADPVMMAKPSEQVVRSKTYYETSAFKNCKADASCQIYFPRIAGSAVIFRRVTCVASHQTPILLSAFGLAKDKSARSLDRYATLSIPPATTGSGLLYSQFNQDVFFRLKEGDMPSVLMVVPDSSATTLSCIATGTPD